MAKRTHFNAISRLNLFRALLVVMFLTVGIAQSFSQTQKKISLKVSNTPLPTVLNKIEDLSGCKISFTYDEVQQYRVTMNVRNQSVSNVMTEALRNTPMEFSIKGKFITVYKSNRPFRQDQGMASSGATRTVKGYVRDSDGELLVGVPICIGESRVCTVTDADGFYTFPIPVEQTVLKYSYVGMETAYVTIPQGSKEVTRDIVMRSDTRLEEVVVTGYQDISKPKMTGSAVVITADKLGERYTANVMNNLEGRVPGLTVYGGKMTIRGTSSLFAETSPLLVVDGLPIEGRIEDLNPADIESVNVLKDAAATAIYGARASNGIIVVTTKNAKTKGKIDIDFSTNLTPVRDKKVVKKVGNLRYFLYLYI